MALKWRFSTEDMGLAAEGRSGLYVVMEESREDGGWKAMKFSDQGDGMLKTGTIQACLLACDLDDCPPPASVPMNEANNMKSLWIIDDETLTELMNSSTGLANAIDNVADGIEIDEENQKVLRDESIKARYACVEVLRNRKNVTSNAKQYRCNLCGGLVELDGTKPTIGLK